MIYFLIAVGGAPRNHPPELQLAEPRRTPESFHPLMIGPWSQDTDKRRFFNRFERLIYRTRLIFDIQYYLAHGPQQKFLCTGGRTVHNLAVCRNAHAKRTPIAHCCTFSQHTDNIYGHHRSIAQPVMAFSSSNSWACCSIPSRMTTLPLVLLRS